jgi:hypothetical protein
MEWIISSQVLKLVTGKSYGCSSEAKCGWGIDDSLASLKSHKIWSNPPWKLGGKLMAGIMYAN